MGQDDISLDHVAFYVTNLERSRKFYQEVLRMSVSEPISLRDQSTGLKYGHSLVTRSPKLLRDWVSRNNPAAYQHMFTDICTCTAADGRVNLILVQQTHPEKGYTRSVTGNTLYGIAFHLSANIDTDDLSWDLGIADMNFDHGDCRTDGTIYTPDHQVHSLYIQDPDGRRIELIPSETGDTSDFLTGMAHAVLYVSDMQKSVRFYQDHLGLIDITPSHIPRDPWKKYITWLGIPGCAPVILLYQVTNPDGTRNQAGGFGLDHLALSGVSTGPHKNEEVLCITGHPGGRDENGIIRDPDGYHIGF